MGTDPAMMDAALPADVAQVLHEAARRDASDVHLVPGYPVTYRIHGTLTAPDSGTLLAPAELERIVAALVPTGLKARLPERKNVDFSLAVSHEGRPCRFRANVYYAQGEQAVCLRHVPEQIPSFEWMGFSPGLAERLVAHRNGLVIITGVTGSGKTTTLAALVDLLNRRGDHRIITVEEPIEYVHRRISTSMVTQREVGRDVESFFEGLKSGLRQDPDVILVGEIRDPETAHMALSAAETGHLILSTLHTKDAKGAVTRFVDLFPHEARDDVRTQLALSLRTVISQHLLPSIRPGEKRALAMEVLHVTNPVRIAIKQGKVESIESAIQTGKRDGMVTLDDDLARLASAGRISVETARHFAKDPQGMGI